MLATGGTRSGKERREGLAFRLVEAFALRHHDGFDVAELRRRCSTRLRLKLVLKGSTLEFVGYAPFLHGSGIAGCGRLVCIGCEADRQAGAQ